MKRRIFGLMIVVTIGLLLPGFPNPTNQTLDKVINITAIPGVTTPVAGASATNSSNSGVVSAVFANTTANLAPMSDVASTTQGSIVFKAVQGGTFNNGTANMTVSSFRMSQNEITMEQFVAVTGLPDPGKYYTDVINVPAHMVNWYHTLVFCNMLSIADGLSPVYSIGGTTDTVAWGAIPVTSSNDTWDAVVADWTANGYRLPTLTEWHFAARGGNYSKNFTYAGSNNIDDVAWYFSNSGDRPHPVGEKTSNELGLNDMSGNVWEWCWDWYVYPLPAQTDYERTASSTTRVICSGSFFNSEIVCSVASWGSNKPFVRYLDLGFRVVRP